MLNDSLANALSAILNHEKTAKPEIVITPTSKIILKILKIMNEQGYIGQIEKITDSKGGYAKVHLLGSINKCGVIKPRFSAKLTDFEKFEKRYLPAKGVGIILVSTPKGIITHYESKEKHIGGRLLAYCY